MTHDEAPASQIPSQNLRPETHDSKLITHNSYDLLIIGSGIAGLYAALLAAPHGRVLVVTKGGLEESNTRYAQGGIAAALAPGDSPELHLRDTISAGDGLCDPERAAILTREAPACILDLLRRGVPFDRQGAELAWTLEAAHSRPRVLHAGGDATGAGVEHTLAAAVREAGVEVLQETLCTRLLSDGERVFGAEILHGAAVREVRASAILLATGGAGQLFSRTTNPSVATGDGLAVAYRAGAELTDLEFFQFHPTALSLPGAPSFLISEAVRGEGGILRDRNGRAFMAGYHPDRELAPRDVVARAIHSEMAATGASHVWLDVTHLPAELIERRFPTIVRFCREHGIDPVREPVPVSPAAHYLMGGIRTDAWGRTSLAGLLACGEAACTGVHGANRLASNSLLEGLVFARRAVWAMSREPRALVEPREWTSTTPIAHSPQPIAHSPRPIAHGPQPTAISEQRTVKSEELRSIMWQHAGLVRSEESLLAARALIDGQSQTPAENTRGAHEAANLALLARLLVTSALARQESRGAHFRVDHLRRDPAWLRHVVLCRGEVRLTERQGVEGDVSIAGR